MSIKEQVTQTLDSLSESELYKVAEYLSFLKFRAHLQAKPAFDEKELASLYSEFAADDRQLADEGMEEYVKDLLAEDTK